MSNLQNPLYDAYMHLITSYQCNLECNYCKATQYGTTPSELYTKTHPINFSALKNALNGLNKIYKITLSGGREFTMWF
ncbi:MAG: hypothetical protein ACFE9S_18975 [Candidatus Hermodarchaeota archaeon]